jgi:hypothetical protein
MRKLLLLLLISPLYAQLPLAMGNLGAITNYAAFTTGLPSPCVNQAVYTITETSGTATLVAGSNLTASGCTTANLVGKTFSIQNTYTDYDGGPYTIVSATSGTTITFTTTNTDGFSHLGTYSHGQTLVQDNNGKLWQFYHLAGGETGSLAFPGCIAIKSSSNNGTTWSNPVSTFCDSSGACNSGASNCGMQNQRSGVAANGNLVTWIWKYDWSTSDTIGVFYASCNPTNDCTQTANWSTLTQLTLVPPGQTAGNFGWGSLHGVPVNLPGGAIGMTAVVYVGSPNPAPQTDAPAYLVISCDNGATWGTGTGCTGAMAQYAANPTRQIQVSPYGTSGYTSLPNEEYNINWVGGTTLLLVGRNNQYTSGCTTPCGPMLLFYSNDLGMTWTQQTTNISGRGLGASCTPTTGTVVSYTEVSPLIYNPNIGAGYLGLIFEDRIGCTGATFTSALMNILFTVPQAISSPTSFQAPTTVQQSLSSVALCGYAGVASIGGSSSNEVLVTFDDETYAGSELSLMQRTASFVSTNPPVIITPHTVINNLVIQ